MGPYLCVDAGDRHGDRARAGVQHPLDRGRGALVERLSPEAAERDANRRSERDEGCEPERTHHGIVSMPPDGFDRQASSA
jgi:hypothetical protein